MKPLSVAIIGAGNIAGGFDEKKQGEDTGVYSHAGAYAAHGGFELKTVFEPERGRGEAFQQFWSVGNLADDLKEIYAGHHDVISVCSPDSTHFNMVRNILTSSCCRTVFVEKPLAMEIHQIEEIIRLADASGIHVVVNFQRRNEPQHRELRQYILAHPGELLSVTGCYMKGLHHIGVTMIDTISYLCGYPDALLTFNRSFNQEVGDYSYEFILYYQDFTVVVKSTDADRFRYNYHLFEIDLLFTDRRMTLVDMSQGLRNSFVTDYAYSGVKIMNEREARYCETGYRSSMVEAIGYLYDISAGKREHAINTPKSSYNNSLLVNTIVASFNRGSVKIDMEQGQWRR